MTAVTNLNLNTYLSKVKNRLSEPNNSDNVTIVIGNESCDLDSAVSCITYAYFMFLNTLKNGNSDENKIINDHLLTIPVLNVNKKNYSVKTEVKYFLNANNVVENNLIFRDDVDLFKLQEQNRLKLILVDHHVLQNDYKGLEKSISKVLDHRPKDKAFVLADDIAIIVPVGSCCTLVTNEIIKTNENILQLNKDIAALLHGTIVLDTFCFDNVIKRFTELDIEMAAKCKELGGVALSNEEVFSNLKKAKADVSGLTLEQLLIKDTKILHCIPISTLTTLVKEFLDKPSAEESIQCFCNVHKAPVCILLGIEKTGGTFKRDVYIYVNQNNAEHDSQVKSPSELADNILRHLYEYTLLDLVRVKDIYNGTLYDQTNLELTRKHILPIIENAYNDYIFTLQSQ